MSYGIFLGSLYLFYDTRQDNFIQNLTDAIELNDSSIVSHYTILDLKNSGFEDSEYNHLYQTLFDLDYEWAVLKDSFENIKSIDIHHLKSMNGNRFPFLSRFNCYDATFNDFPFAKMTICTEDYFNKTEINYISYDYNFKFKQ